MAVVSGREDREFRAGGGIAPGEGMELGRGRLCRANGGAGWKAVVVAGRPDASGNSAERQGDCAGAMRDRCRELRNRRPNFFRHSRMAGGGLRVRVAHAGEVGMLAAYERIEGGRMRTSLGAWYAIRF